jgi:hypothetical protein
MSDGRPVGGGSSDEARDGLPVVIPGGAGTDFSKAPASPARPGSSSEPAETVPRGTDQVPGSTMPEGKR